MMNPSTPPPESWALDASVSVGLAQRWRAARTPATFHSTRKLFYVRKQGNAFRALSCTTHMTRLVNVPFQRALPIQRCSRVGPSPGGDRSDGPLFRIVTPQQRVILLCLRNQHYGVLCLNRATGLMEWYDSLGHPPPDFILVSNTAAWSSCDNITTVIASHVVSHQS